MDMYSEEFLKKYIELVSISIKNLLEASELLTKMVKSLTKRVEHLEMYAKMKKR